MRSKKEFIARDIDGKIKKWDDIGREIGADSLAYISMDGLKRAIGSDICRGCIDFPDGNPKEWKNEVLELFKKDKHGIRAYESCCMS
jgi:glutamine phosphoribosylpyrophosphate amidotransferase